jgi:hypothetical protein
MSGAEFARVLEAALADMESKAPADGDAAVAQEITAAAYAEALRRRAVG